MLVLAEDGDQNRGPELLAVTWVFTSVALLVVIAKFYTRVKVLHSTGLDDVLVILSMVNQAKASMIYGFIKSKVWWC